MKARGVDPDMYSSLILEGDAARRNGKLLARDLKKREDFGPPKR